MITKLAASAAVCAAALTAHAQVLLNTGFETGGDSAGDSAFWSEGAGGAPGTVSVRSNENPNSGDWHHRLIAVGAAGIGGSAGVTQNSAANFPSLTPGTTISLSFDAATDLGPGGVAFYALRILNRNGTIVGETGLVGIGHSGGVYTTITSAELTVPDFGADPNDFYSVFVELVVNAGAFDGSIASMDVDNVRVTVIPAPASAAMLGIAGIAAARRRR